MMGITAASNAEEDHEDDEREQHPERGAAQGYGWLDTLDRLASQLYLERWALCRFGRVDQPADLC
jgi:hypothetical protein